MKDVDHTIRVIVTNGLSLYKVYQLPSLKPTYALITWFWLIQKYHLFLNWPMLQILAHYCMPIQEIDELACVVVAQRWGGDGRLSQSLVWCYIISYSPWKYLFTWSYLFLGLNPVGFDLRKQVHTFIRSLLQCECCLVLMHLFFRSARGKTLTYECSEPILARYVTIETLRPTGGSILCEVRVFATSGKSWLSATTCK